MKFEVFKKVIDELWPYLTNLELYNWGEPLLHKDLVEMIRYAKDRDVPVCISTNLNKLHEKTARDLIATFIDKIFISCDGASQETYAKYRIGGDFDKLITNVRHLTKVKKALGNDYTRVILLFHVFRHNEHEIDKIKKLAEDMGVELRINRMRTDMGKEIFETVEESVERDKEWIPQNEKYSFFDVKRKERKVQFRCKHLWKTAVINWDGSVLPCCAVYGEKYAFGNILREPFRSIWNNEVYRRARKEILDTIEDSHTICHTCKTHGFLHF